jgi:hypothetical protein
MVVFELLKVYFIDIITALYNHGLGKQGRTTSEKANTVHVELSTTQIRLSSHEIYRFTAHVYPYVMTL